MHIPPLFAWNNSTGPQWVVPELSPAELQDLSRATVMFVGRDPRGDGDEWTVLGSGFIVGVADTIIVATASHIFTWWVDKVAPPPPHLMKGATGDRDDLNRRMRKVIPNGGIAAVVNPRCSQDAAMLPIVGIAINSNPRDLDGGYVQLALPPKFKRDDFGQLLIDADPFQFEEPVLMVGYVGGQIVPAVGMSESSAFCNFRMVVRAGRVAELIHEPDGFRAPMYRVNIPSLPGMSGGPLIALRKLQDTHGVAITAVGVVSSSRLGSPILLSSCSEGETLVCPIVTTLGRNLLVNGISMTISKAILDNVIDSFGHVVRRFQVTRREEDGVAIGEVTPLPTED